MALCIVQSCMGSLPPHAQSVELWALDLGTSISCMGACDTFYGKRAGWWRLWVSVLHRYGKTANGQRVDMAALRQLTAMSYEAALAAAALKQVHMPGSGGPAVHDCAAPPCHQAQRRALYVSLSRSNCDRKALQEMKSHMLLSSQNFPMKNCRSTKFSNPAHLYSLQGPLRAESCGCLMALTLADVCRPTTTCIRPWTCCPALPATRRCNIVLLTNIW